MADESRQPYDRAEAYFHAFDARANQLMDLIERLEERMEKSQIEREMLRNKYDKEILALTEAWGLLRTEIERKEGILRTEIAVRHGALTTQIATDNGAFKSELKEQAVKLGMIWGAISAAVASAISAAFYFLSHKGPP